ncbi:hypothetical protein TRVL_03551 [Trypanosoma vivax]|nr:hypothetical protein TRVL_03551 [Trypanosoma vivax]
MPRGSFKLRPDVFDQTICCSQGVTATETITFYHWPLCSLFAAVSCCSVVVVSGAVNGAFFFSSYRMVSCSNVTRLKKQCFDGKRGGRGRQQEEKNKYPKTECGCLRICIALRRATLTLPLPACRDIWHSSLSFFI